MIQQLVPAQVPRRFPVGTMLLLVTMFAVLLSILRTAGVPPVGITLIGGWVLVIAIAQMLLYKGKKPRQASMVAGAVVGVLAWLLFAAVPFFWAGPPRGNLALIVTSAIISLLSVVVVVGPGLGYVTGCGLAGVFLIANRILSGRWNEVREVEIPVLAELVNPFAARIECPQPILKTQRLRLRPFALADAREVQRLAGDAEVASTTFRMPHPYEDGVAEAWIATHAEKYRNGEEVVFAVAGKDDDQLIGAISLRLWPDQAKAELGYWIGLPYWNQGYATEAAAAALQYGFQQLGLISIFAHHMVRNPASGRVMQKIGMQHKAKLRQFIEKNGMCEDCHWYELLRYEWDGSDRSNA